MKAATVGIDLGTTYSCMATYDGENIEVLQTTDRTIPSYVYYDPKSERVFVGKAAENKRNPNVIYDVKRFIGKRYDNKTVKSMLKNYACSVIRSPDGEILFEIPYNDQVVQKKPEEVSSEILRFLKETAVKVFKTDKIDAVITVPAYFNNNQKKKTMKAAELAGINVLRLMNEPTAAALRYFHGGYKKNLKAMIFDLGGGTFDIAIVTINDEEIDVEAVDGDSFLGGRNFDENILNYLKQGFDENKRTITKKYLLRLKTLSRVIKEDLSHRENAQRSIDCFWEDEEDLDIALDRSTFNEINEKDFEKCLNLVKRILEQNNIKKNDIDEIIMVGGSSKIPKLQEMLSEFFQKEKLMCDLDVDEAVAGGAAIQAYLIGNKKYSTANDMMNKLTIRDVIPATIGLETTFDLMSALIPRNSKIPVTTEKTYKTSVNNQKRLVFNVFEGERKCVKQNTYLGQIIIDDIPAKPAGQVSIKVIFQVAENGLLKIVADYDGIQKELTLNISNDVVETMEEGDDNQLNNDKADKLFEELVKLKLKLKSLYNKNVKTDASGFNGKLKSTNLDNKWKLKGIIDDLNIDEDVKNEMKKLC